MTLVPGMSYANQSQWSVPSTYDSASDFGFSNPFDKAPVSACTPAVPTPSASAPQPPAQPATVYAPANPSTTMVPPPTQLPQDMAIRTVPQVATHPELPPQVAGGPFRPSIYQLNPDFMSASSQMPFQTSIFRKSVSFEAHHDFHR
jgi:ubiquitin thioesterase protein OTUB1